MKKLLTLRKILDEKKKLIQSIFIVLVSAFVLTHLLRNWNEIREYNWDFNYAYLLSSFVLGMLVPVVTGFVWYLILRHLRCDLKFRKALKIMSLSMLAKYLPGMGWNYLVQMNMCEKEGVRKAKAGVSIILERTICFMAGVFAFLISLVFWKGLSLEKSVYFILLTIPIALIIIHPKVLSKLLNFVLRIIKSRPIDIPIRYRNLMFLTICYVFFAWGIGGIAFHLFIQSIFPVQVNPLIVIGILAIGVNIGLLAPFMPGGLIVREAMLVSLLQFYIPIDVAIMIAIGYRFLISINELIFATVASRL